MPMLRSQGRGKGKRILIVAGLFSALVGGSGMHPVDSATAVQTDWIQSQAEARSMLEYEQVLDVVRDHRQAARDTWRRTLAKAIVKEAQAEHVDPLLIASIVARESSFRTRVVSHAGAVGLMQLRPWVAEDLALRTDVEWAGVQTLHTPHLNVRLGVRYYKELLERFGDERIALTAYCYGPSRVARQLRRGTYSGSRYAEDILGLYRRLTEENAV
jgi:soluble lytic murein transglycosylase